MRTSAGQVQLMLLSLRRVAVLTLAACLSVTGARATQVEVREVVVVELPAAFVN